MAEFLMPSLGADMVAGRVVEWRVKPGDEVHRGDIVACVDTSKAEIDIEIFEDGIVEELLVPAGERVPVGTVLATIRPLGAAAPAEPAAPTEPVAAAPPAGPAPAVTPAEPPPAAAAVEPAPATSGDGARPLASPFARRIAAERGIDLATVDGSGPDGAVVSADLSAAPPAHEPPAPARAEPSAPVAAGRAESMRQAIAAAMARSKREIPHYHLATTIDMSATLEWLAARNAKHAVRDRVLPAACTLKAVALAARDFPDLNGFWIDGAPQPSGAVHLGVAVALREGGLIAPAIHDADAMPLDELMAALRDLVARVRSGGLRSSELTDATLTVTSLGDRGAEAVFGVIYPPQVALVGFGAITERAVARDGLVGARRCTTATLAADHRASDGHRGSAFLAAIHRHLQTPETL